jgi:hypothetical protein
MGLKWLVLMSTFFELAATTAAPEVTSIVLSLVTNYN